MERPTARQSAWQWQERIGIRDRKTLDGDQSLFFNRLMDLGDPLEDFDAVNKKYVDDVFGDGEIIVVIGSVDDIADLDLDPGSIAGSDADAVMAVHLAMYDHTLIGSGVDLTEHLAAYDHTNIHPSNIIDGDTVDVSGRDTGDVLTWNGAMWVPASIIYPADSGWIEVFETWTYASADAPTFTFTVVGDKSTKYYPGMRIKLTQTTVKYFIITKVVYSSPNTTVTVYGGTDYTLANEAIIYPYYSSAKAPAGFPLDPTKWTVTVTDSTQRSKTTDISDSTWYNIDAAAQISVPIGIWNVSYMVYGSSSVTATPAWHAIRVCLSSSSNSCSDNLSLQEHLVLTDLDNNILSVATIKVVTTAKTTYYVNIQCSASTAITLLRYYNDLYPMVIKAECAYL